MDAFDEIYISLPEDVRERLGMLFSVLRFTESQKLEAAKEEADLVQWGERSFALSYDPDLERERKDGRGRDRYISAMRKHMHELRSSETDYSSFFPPRIQRPKTRSIEDDRPLVIGRCPCPVDGEKTRCCNLRTLDAAAQCAFGCSYCSVQAFYNENRILVAKDLGRRLEEIELPEGTWHIGTGQASDSLLLGDDCGTLSGLSSFASAHPGIAIELKSKSDRNVFDRPWPRNMIFTWSLNAPTIAEKEEHLTASLEGRLDNAERAVRNGSLVGFHIHPMVYFKGWKDEYRHVVESITSRFSPENVVMISIGTLVFTKAVMQRLRRQGNLTRVLEMELEKTAGKYSYPFEKKREMFSYVSSLFPPSWHESVFFYLCMEDPRLWMPVLGREYSCDREFEEDMKRHYLGKILSTS
ncbi:MAG: DNA photolyase [Candidatus Ornithospirochaeta sp.]|nr:DNA photolyase [Candidatus Ornithospirochaeta sp.]